MLRLNITAALSIAVIAACGGGGDDADSTIVTPPPTATVPTTAIQAVYGNLEFDQPVALLQARAVCLAWPLTPGFPWCQRSMFPTLEPARHWSPTSLGFRLQTMV